jgi:hypothetical protein
MALTVLHITGWCRSGSTVLGNVLAEVPGVFHAGELRYLWCNGVLGAGSNRRCGCGADLVGCPLWSEVLAAGRPPDRSLTAHAADVVRWQARCRTRHTGRVLRRPPANGWPATLAATYRAVAARTGATVIVDSSKYAADAALLTHLTGIRPAFLHLVRDPRGVAHSWQRPKDYTGRRGPASSTLYWLAFNRAAERLARAHPAASRRLRYEDLTSDPRASVATVLDLLDLPAGANPVTPDGSVQLGANHTVTGNPNRFHRGPTTLTEDRRWHAAITRPTLLTTTLLATPQLTRYGYPRTPR